MVQGQDSKTVATSFFASGISAGSFFAALAYHPHPLRAAAPLTDSALLFLLTVF